MHSFCWLRIKIATKKIHPLNKILRGLPSFCWCSLECSLPLVECLSTSSTSFYSWCWSIFRSWKVYSCTITITEKYTISAQQETLKPRSTKRWKNQLALTIPQLSFAQFLRGGDLYRNILKFRKTGENLKKITSQLFM